MDCRIGTVAAAGSKSGNVAVSKNAARAGEVLVEVNISTPGGRSAVARSWVFSIRRGHWESTISTFAARPTGYDTPITVCRPPALIDAVDPQLRIVWVAAVQNRC